MDLTEFALFIHYFTLIAPLIIVLWSILVIFKDEIEDFIKRIKQFVRGKTSIW
jgi:hypothetical protein